MTSKQFNGIIYRLGLSHYKAAKWLGIGMRSVYSYKGGSLPIPREIARLMEHHGTTPEQASEIWGER